jgi:hypothetical protein
LAASHGLEVRKGRDSGSALVSLGGEETLFRERSIHCPSFVRRTPSGRTPTSLGWASRMVPAEAPGKGLEDEADAVLLVLGLLACGLDGFACRFRETRVRGALPCPVIPWGSFRHRHSP